MAKRKTSNKRKEESRKSFLTILAGLALGLVLVFAIVAVDLEIILQGFYKLTCTAVCIAGINFCKFSAGRSINIGIAVSENRGKINLFCFLVKRSDDYCIGVAVGLIKTDKKEVYNILASHQRIFRGIYSPVLKHGGKVALTS